MPLRTESICSPSYGILMVFFKYTDYHSVDGGDVLTGTPIPILNRPDCLSYVTVRVRVTYPMMGV